VTAQELAYRLLERGYEEYKVKAYNPDTEQFEEVTGVVTDPVNKTIELQTDGD